MEDIAKLADKVIVLNEGKLEMMGTPREVFRNEQRLNQIGLTVPQMTSLFHRLAGFCRKAGSEKKFLPWKRERKKFCVFWEYGGVREEQIYEDCDRPICARNVRASQGGIRGPNSF